MTALPADPPGILPRVYHSFLADANHYTPGRANATGMPVGTLLHTSEGVDSRLWLTRTSGATDPRNRVSANTLGQQNGIYALVAPLNTAWHAGWCKHPTGEWWHNPNADLFGHEIEHLAGRPYTATDYNQAAWIHARGVFSFGYPHAALYTHAQIAVYPPDDPRAGQFGRKGDPTVGANGKPFDVARVLREAQAWLTFFDLLPPSAHQYWIVDGAGETLGGGGLV
jgi:hypothetical protein